MVAEESAVGISSKGGGGALTSPNIVRGGVGKGFSGTLGWTEQAVAVKSVAMKTPN